MIYASIFIHDSGAIASLAQYYVFKEGVPLQDFLATCRNYCNFKTIFYQVVMGYPYKVIILQASCRKVRGFPTKIVVNL